MTDDLNFLIPQLFQKHPKARLGLSRGYPAVYVNGVPPGRWPFTGDSWEGVIQEALRWEEPLPRQEEE